ncbi:MAG TPA: RHS repeat-associated core domain-containing protein [Verrucomicrobiae bacterium]
MNGSNHSSVRFCTRGDSRRTDSRRLAGRFRKACRSCSPLYSANLQAVRKSSRSCFEGLFGEVIRATSPMVKANPFRFSTKYQDDETDLVYYGYRYCDASTGRWLNRDPIGEGGGQNLYASARNSHVVFLDPDGRIIFTRSCVYGAQRILIPTVHNVCATIDSSQFSACIGNPTLASSVVEGLRRICKNRDKLTIDCDIKCNPGARAWGENKTQTIHIVNGGFYKDGCGWRRECAMGHEMLHLLGYLHPRSDRLFNRLHECLGCERYREL